MRSHDEKVAGLKKVADAVEGAHLFHPTGDVLYVAGKNSHAQVVYEEGGYDFWDMTSGDGKLLQADMTLEQAIKALRNANPEVEWVNKYAMREVAEAVGTTTELVMAVHSSGIVLYTPEGTEEIWSATLNRDADGIAVAGPGKFMATFAEFEKDMKEGLDKKFRQLEAEGKLPPRKNDE